MSAIPPHLAGAILQAGVQQHHVARVQDGEREQQRSAAERGVRNIEQKTAAIGDRGGDTEVHTESEGAGSQGRSFDTADDDRPREDPPQTGGIHRGDDGRLHVDLEA